MSVPFRELNADLFKPQGKKFAMNVAIRHHRTDEIISYRYIEADTGLELAEKYHALSSSHRNVKNK